MRESEFQGWVTDVATRFGWRWWHVPAPMRAARVGGFVAAKEAAGLPDLVLMHEEPCLIIAELKGDGGSLTPEQREFLRLASLVAEDICDEYMTQTDPALRRNVPFGVYAWRPGDEAAIETILRSRVLA